MLIVARRPDPDGAPMRAVARRSESDHRARPSPSHDPAEGARSPDGLRGAARRRSSPWPPRPWRRGSGRRPGPVVALCAERLNTSDYGFIIGQSYRVLHGEIPTSTSSRPDPPARPSSTSWTSCCHMPLVESSRLVALYPQRGRRSALRRRRAGPSTVAVDMDRAPRRRHRDALHRQHLPDRALVQIDGLIFVVGSLAALRLWDERGNLGLPGRRGPGPPAPRRCSSRASSRPVLPAGWVVLRLHGAPAPRWRRLVTAAVLIGLPVWPTWC